MPRKYKILYKHFQIINYSPLHRSTLKKFLYNEINIRNGKEFLITKFNARRLCDFHKKCKFFSLF